MQLVSVIIPVYNAEKYIENCLKSVVNQTYSQIEVIIVDDGSTDASASICGKFLEDERVSLYSQKNQGVSSARNEGMKHAKGEFLLFVDADDELKVNMIERLVQLIGNSGADIAICGIELRSEAGNVLSAQMPVVSGVLDGKEALAALLKDDLRIRSGTWNKLFRRSIINFEFMLGRRINEDRFFSFQALGNAGTIALTSEQLYCYYHRDTSASHSGFSDKFFDIAFFAEKMYTIVKNSCPELEPAARFNLVQSKYLLLEKILKSGSASAYSQEKSQLENDIIPIEIRDIANDFSLKRRIALFVMKHSTVLFEMMIQKTAGISGKG